MANDKHIEIMASIDQYIRGKLSQDEIDSLWITFLQHPEYYEWFETELHLRGIIKKGKKPGMAGEDNPAERPDAKPPSNILSLRTWMIATAAAVLLAAGLQLFSLGVNQTEAEWAIASIGVAEMTGADVLRSDDEDVSALDVSINEALSAAYNEDYTEAMAKFSLLLEQNPNNSQKARIMMNLGILHYNQTDYELAKTHFESVVATEQIENHFIEKAWWFLGNAHLNLMELDEAREAVFNAYSMDGRYQTPALSLLKKLDMRLGYTPPEALN